MFRAGWIVTHTPLPSVAKREAHGGAHLGTATVAQAGPDASRCIGISPNGIRQVGGLPIRDTADCQSALRACLEPYRWQCQTRRAWTARQNFPRHQRLNTGKIRPIFEGKL